MRPTHLCYGNSYTGNTASWYWDGLVRSHIGSKLCVHNHNMHQNIGVIMKSRQGKAFLLMLSLLSDRTRWWTKSLHCRLLATRLQFIPYLSHTSTLKHKWRHSNEDNVYFFLHGFNAFHYMRLGSGIFEFICYWYMYRWCQKLGKYWQVRRRSYFSTWR